MKKIKKIKKYLLLFTLAFIYIVNSQAQISSTLGIKSLDKPFSQKYVCVLYNSENKVIGALNKDLKVVSFDENHINTYDTFYLEPLLNNSLNLSNINGIVTRNGNGLKYTKQADYEKAFKRKANPTPGDPYIISDQKVRNVYYFTITDKGKESGYIGLEKPMMNEAKLRLYIVK